MKMFENVDDVLKSETPVLVDFYTDWCRPCKMITPILAKIDEEMGDKVKIVKVNVEKHQDFASNYNISAIPTLMMFKNGENVGSVLGFQTADQIRDLINKSIAEK